MWPRGDHSSIVGPTGAKMATFSDAVEWREGKKVNAAAAAAAGSKVCVGQRAAR